jgi:hypothetical protein
VVTGTSHGHPFVALEYDDLDYAVVMKLPKALPHVEVRSKELTADTSLESSSIELESEEFNRRFWVHAEDAAFASAVVTPRLMEDLLAGPPICWRIWESDLVAWWPGQLTPDRVLPALEVLHTVEDRIPGFVWHQYGKTEPAA